MIYQRKKALRGDANIGALFIRSGQLPKPSLVLPIRLIISPILAVQVRCYYRSDSEGRIRHSEDRRDHSIIHRISAAVKILFINKTI